MPRNIKQTPLLAHKDPSGRLLGDTHKHVLDKRVGSEEGNRNILLVGAMLVLPTKSETQLSANSA